jgi:CO/xanthine dehydrogenase Mo-binding subunit
MPDSKILGQNYPRVDAADKVSGRSQYASDVYLPGMLMCKVLKSPKRMPASCTSIRPGRRLCPGYEP